MSRLLITIVLLCLSYLPSARGQSQCLVEFCNNPKDTQPQGCYNPDSVLVDTCNGSPTRGALFGTHWFWFYFAYHVVNVPSSSFDTVIEVSWTAIDTNYATLRAAFSALQKKYGQLWLRVEYPGLTDTLDPGINVFRLRFEEYTCVDSVLNDIEEIPLVVHPGFISYPTVIAGGVGTDPTPNVLRSVYILRHEGASYIVSRSDHTSVGRIELYDLRGSKCATIDASDQQTVLLPIEHLLTGTYIVLCRGAIVGKIQVLQ